MLILDNLESITGANLAIQHILGKGEQEALRRFLADLSGGRTLVLLGSRGGEAWLAQGTFGNNMYDLPGLDPEAASTLADLILEEHGATKYRSDDDLRHLLKLLDGFPLALEVVLPNLARQAPKEVLSALQVGDVDLDTGDPEDKTKSILRCIDYSHSNLSPEAQQLLLCLAPFTSVIDQGMLENYTAQLRQQPALAALPFERWPEVLQEAANWGLLSPDPDIPRFLRLQPIFPYFLRNRLDTADLSPLRAAVETAFRLHYDQVGNALYDLLQSKEPQERQVGQILTSLEYTNLSTALDLALAAQVSILNLYLTLSTYLDSTQEQQRGLDLGQSVLKRLETYPSEKLTGMLGTELAVVIDDIAKRQLLLKNYKEAEALYRKALAILLENKSYEADRIKQRSASIYHQLGRVAEEQRQWEQAEAYYQQALQIKIEYQDRYAQATPTTSWAWWPRSSGSGSRQKRTTSKPCRSILSTRIGMRRRAPTTIWAWWPRSSGSGSRQKRTTSKRCRSLLSTRIGMRRRAPTTSWAWWPRSSGSGSRQKRTTSKPCRSRLSTRIGMRRLRHLPPDLGDGGRGAAAKWEQARDYYLLALETFVAFNDDYKRNIVLRSLARLWLASGDGIYPLPSRKFWV